MKGDRAVGGRSLIVQHFDARRRNVEMRSGCAKELMPAVSWEKLRHRRAIGSAEDACAPSIGGVVGGHPPRLVVIGVHADERIGPGVGRAERPCKACPPERSAGRREEEDGHDTPACIADDVHHGHGSGDDERAEGRYRFGRGGPEGDADVHRQWKDEHERHRGRCGMRGDHPCAPRPDRAKRGEYEPRWNPDEEWSGEQVGATREFRRARDGKAAPNE